MAILIGFSEKMAHRIEKSVSTLTKIPQNTRLVSMTVFDDAAKFGDVVIVDDMTEISVRMANKLSKKCAVAVEFDNNPFELRARIFERTRNFMW